MPETVFLKDGKFECVVQLDKDFCLSLDNKTKLSNLKVRVKLQDSLKERRMESGYLCMHKALMKRNYFIEQ
jgi:hypothetical protein